MLGYHIISSLEDRLQVCMPTVLQNTATETVRRLKAYTGRAECYFCQVLCSEENIRPHSDLLKGSIT
jgi:Pyruvate/2-oxoacid:ferredoxin oxidoreductase delta subunit